MTVSTAPLAKELMQADIISIPSKATLTEAAIKMNEYKISALPVVDKSGFPIGVLSQTDLVRHQREYPDIPPSHYFHNTALFQDEETAFHLQVEDQTLVLDVMTPMVYTVKPDTPLEVVIDRLLEKSIHRLFVTDTEGKLSGVISAFDLLRYYRKKG